ncbi:MAG TPA: fused MFS/spermidine synthase, partial [Bacteroidales bacterium]|nr:fused MFS/spermidine synthase [Bacteroidales bacterium]
LGQVMVADLFRDETGQPLNERVLFINRRGHTIISRPGNVSRWDYVHYAEVIASRYPKNSKALMLGLGGGTLASALVEHLGFTVDAVELDSRIANVASEFFSLHPSVRVIVDDARHFIETTNNKYDFIFFDVFTSDAQPPHVLSRECYEKAATLLQPNGMIAINFFGFIDGDAGFAARSVYKTLTAAGFYVKILPTPGTEAYRNILFIASAKPQDIEELNSLKVTADTIPNENSGFIHLNQRNLHDANVYTDDKSNLESAVLEAGYAWRKGYNEYYTKFFTKSGIPLFR